MKKFLIVGLALVSSLFSQPTPIVWKVQASWPASSLVYSNLTEFAGRVEKLSGGRLKIDALPAGAIVGPLEVLDATSRGVIDGAHTFTGFYVGKSRAAMALSTGTSYGMDYVDWYGWYHEGGGAELYQEWYDTVIGANVVHMPVAPAGPQAFGWFKQKINTVEDLKGLKIRTPGLNAEVLKDFGASPVNIPAGEILPAAERGLIDAVEWVGGVDDLNLGIQNVFKIHYVRSLCENTTVADMVFNKDAWKALPDDLKAIVQAAADQTFWRWYVLYNKQNAGAYLEMGTKYSVEVLPTPKDILVAFANQIDVVFDREAEKDPFFKKVVDSKKKYAGLMVPYRRSVWTAYEFLGDHYWKKDIYLKD